MLLPTTSCACHVVLLLNALQHASPKAADICKPTQTLHTLPLPTLPCTLQQGKPTSRLDIFVSIPHRQLRSAHSQQAASGCLLPLLCKAAHRVWLGQATHELASLQDR